MRAVCTFSFLALLTVAPSAFAAGADPGDATAVQREQAQARFSRGKTLYEAGKFEDAATELKASIEIVASPNARLYYARALREAGHLVRAYVELGRTEVEAREHAKEDGRYEKAAETAAAERAALKPKLGFVTVHVDNATDDTKLTVGGEEIKRAGWTEPAPVVPGSSDVVLETPGHAPSRQSVAVKAGHTENLTIDAMAGGAASTTPSADSSSASASASTTPFDRTTLRPYAYVAGGVAAAGFLTFIVAGVLSNGTYGDLQNKCGSSPCPASMSDEISRGKTEQTIANVGLVFGILGAVTGGALFVVSMPKKQTTAATISPAVSLGWVGMKGSF
jgi:hypothetical protein